MWLFCCLQAYVTIWRLKYFVKLFLLIALVVYHQSSCSGLMHRSGELQIFSSNPSQTSLNDTELVFKVIFLPKQYIASAFWTFTFFYILPHLSLSNYFVSI